MNSPRRLITPTIWLLSLVSLFTDIASEMLYPIMPVYLKSIGFSVALIGILEGVAEATAGLSKGYFGHLSDTLQKRVPFIRAGYSLSAITKPMMAFFTYPVWIFFARTLDRFGKGLRTSARDALLSDETEPKSKGKIFGFHRSMDTVGAAIGPTLALIFLYFYPGQYKPLFYIAFFPGVAAILLTFLLKDRRKVNTASLKKGIGFFSYLKYWRTATPAYRYLVGGLLAFTLFNSSDAFLLLALKTRGFSDLQLIGFYIFFNLVYAMFSFPVGILADRVGLDKMLLAGLFLFSGVYFTYGFVATVPLIALLFFLYGLYYAATEGVSKALISNLVKKEDTATAIGFYNSFASIFAMVSSSLAGLIWFATGEKTMFMISGIGVFGVAIYLLFTLRRNSPHPAEG